MQKKHLYPSAQKEQQGFLSRLSSLFGNVEGHPWPFCALALQASARITDCSTVHARQVLSNRATSQLSTAALEAQNFSHCKEISLYVLSITDTLIKPFLKVNLGY